MFPSEDIARALSNLEKRIERLERLDQVFTINAAETVINEAGIDRDLRIEGLADPNLIVVNAGLDRVGIGIAVQGEKLHVLDGAAQVVIGAGFPGFGGVGFGASMAGNSYSLLGEGVNTYINAPTGNIFFRQTNNNRMVIIGNDVGIGIFAGLGGRLHVDQFNAVSAIPTLVLGQSDISEGFINFIGSDRGAITGVTNSVASVRAELGGTVYRLALYADA